MKKAGIWRFFSSVKLAIWLLAVIAILSLIGTFIPQNESPAFYIEKIGHAGYSALLKTGLNNIYSSWWFVLFLALLALNLAVCLLNRLPLKIRSLGTFIAHLGILVIFLGAFIGMIYGEKGVIKISKTKEMSSFMSKGRKVDLGFSIRLDDFIYSEHIDTKEKLLVYPVRDKVSGGINTGRKGAHHGMRDLPGLDTSQAPIGRLNTEVGSESKIADTGCSVRVLRYLPDFVMDMSTKEVMTRSALPNNPAIEVELKDKDGSSKTFWTFARFPEIHQEADANFKFVYNWVERRPKDFISKVTVLKGNKEVMARDIRVNEPLSFDGYTFFQSSYDTEGHGWSGLQIAKDPGVPVVYAGFMLLIAGFTIVFYVNPIIRRN